MKTLYVADADGTLPGSDEKTSGFTNQTINVLAACAMLFSYAAARSSVTSTKATRGLDAHIPQIVYACACAAVQGKTSRCFGKESSRTCNFARQSIVKIPRLYCKWKKNMV